MRKIGDYPWGNYKILIILQAKKFYCYNSLCRRQIFTERFPSLIQSYARTTNRLKNRLIHLALFYGINPLIKLKNQLLFTQSSSTLLRWCHHHSVREKEVAQVRVLGVDDWALKKGKTYGTILVDLEKNIPIDLLVGRGKKDLSEWLKNHPEVEIVSRDRAGNYSSAVLDALPKAIQIADRWHLINNFSKLVKRILLQKKKLLDKASLQVNQVKKLPIGKFEKRFESVKRLQKEKMSGRKISEILGISKQTVYKYMNASVYPHREFTSLGLPFKDYLMQQWKIGNRSIRTLWLDICEKGYQGGEKSLVNFLNKHIKPHFKNYIKRTSEQVHALLFVRTDDLNSEDKEYRDALFSLFPELEKIRLLYFRFKNLLVFQKNEKLDDWLEEAESVPLQLIKSFVKGLKEDYDAVKNAASFNWSNGPVEGQINKLKMVKRMGYGRDSIELLEKKLLIRNMF